MSILNRLNRIIRSNVNDLRSGSHPDSLNQVLGEMESSLKEARRQKVVLRKQEAKLVAAIRQQRDKADQWEDRAMMALKKGEEDLARDALVVRNEALDEAAKLRDELEEHRMYLQDIDSALEALEMKLEGTRGRLRASSTTAARPPRSLRDERDWDAEFRRRVEDRGASAPRSTPTRGAFEDDHLFDEIDRMGSKIDAFEAEVEAMRELSDDNLGDPGRRRLEERFRRLEQHDRPRRSRDDSGDDLADLKRKFED